MNYNDDWAEGLNQKQQNIVIDYVLDLGRIPDNKEAKQKYDLTKQTVVKFLKSEKGKKAVRRYVKSKHKSKEDLARMAWLNIHFARAFTHPGDIITPEGEFVKIDGKPIESLHQLGPKGYCVEGVETKYVNVGGETIKEIKIKLCNKDKSLEAIKNIYRMDEDDDYDDDEKSILEMSDDERDEEILKLVKNNPALLEYVKGGER